METERFEYATPSGRVCIEFDGPSHTYGVGRDWDSLDLVPAVSSLTDYLPKFLTSWGQGIGVKGVLELLRRSVTEYTDEDTAIVDLSRLPFDDPKFVQDELKAYGLDHNAVRDDAAKRGSAVHAAFREFVSNGTLPDAADYGTAEAKGYIQSLRMFCEAIKGNIEPILCEEPVASMELGVAGTPDLFCNLKTSRLQVGGNASKRPKFDDVAGRPLIDLKTSKEVYTSHRWQLSFYQRMIVECGFEPPTERAIVLIKADAEGYNWKPQADRTDSIAALTDVYNAESRSEGWSA